MIRANLFRCSLSQPLANKMVTLLCKSLFHSITDITSVKKEFYELIDDCEDAAKDDVELIREDEKELEQKMPLPEKGNKDP